MKRLLVIAAPLLLAARAHAAPEGVRFFEEKIRPILVEHCYPCHSQQASKTKGGLSLDTRAGWEKGGELGPAIRPGRPDDGLVVRAVRYKDGQLEMPPDGPLPARAVALLEEWVRIGAPDPRDGAPAKIEGPKKIDLVAARKHWAFAPLRPLRPPKVLNEAWVRTPIDRFVLAAQEARGIAPSPPAEKVALLRRMTFDLTGLPPTPSETLAFVTDPGPDAYERVVDRLLASPRHGERWARHWLDVARFAESDGFEQDYDPWTGRPRARVALRRGRNVLVWKVVNAAARWEGRVGVFTSDGQPLTGVETGLDPPLPDFTGPRAGLWP